MKAKILFILSFVFMPFFVLASENINNEGPETMSQKQVIEIVMFKVKDPEMGIQAARAVVEDAQAFNNAVVSSEVYQSATDPNLITQRIIWTSLDQAKAAFAASEGFANMGTLMGQITEQVFFDHFYHVNQ